MRLLAVLCLAALAALAQPAGRIVIDYPLEGSVFSPDFAAPTFLFRDPLSSNTAWRAEIRFRDGGPPIRLEVQARWLEPGEIDCRAVADTNELPKVPPEMAATRTLRPDRAVWEEIRKPPATSNAHSSSAPAIPRRAAPTAACWSRPGRRKKRSSICASRSSSRRTAPAR
jgi:hypothetical protein